MGYQYTLNLKNEGQERKTNLFWVWVPVGGGHKESGNEGKCILYPYRKTEE
jgi:hypothetical protein